MLSERTLRAVLVGVLALILAAAIAMEAKARPSYTPAVQPRRVGLRCEEVNYLIWQARACVTLRARKDHLGQWEFQPAAALAGYNRDGRRKMRLVAAVRLEDRATHKGPVYTERLVVRGGWQVGLDVVDPATAVFVWRWPNGRKSALKLFSRA